MTPLVLQCAAVNDAYDNDTYGYDSAEAGPTLGVAVVAWLLGLAGTFTILILRSRATNEHEGPFRKCISGGGGIAGEASVEHSVATV